MLLSFVLAGIVAARAFSIAALAGLLFLEAVIAVGSAIVRVDGFFHLPAVCAATSIGYLLAISIEIIATKSGFPQACARSE